MCPDTLTRDPESRIDNRRLSGRTALVTGSTSGIGLAIAHALAADGANVVINGLGDLADADRLATEIGDQYQVEVVACLADMHAVDAIAAMVARARSTLGEIDILVNNAGVQHVAPVESFPSAKWDAILAINLTAAFHTIRETLPGMKARGWGRIVNVVSAHGLVASSYKSAYVAAKHGLVGLTRTVALEVAETAITCNAICPGYVWTPLVENQIEDQARAHGITREEVVRTVLLAQQPNRRFATVGEIGALTAFLCSSAAASITGAALPVDGGWTAH